MTRDRALILLDQARIKLIQLQDHLSRMLAANAAYPNAYAVQEINDAQTAVALAEDDVKLAQINLDRATEN